MDWRRIIKQAESGDPVEFKRSMFDEDSLERLPEDASLLVHDTEPELWITRDGGTVLVQVEWSFRAGYWEHKYTLRVFTEAMMRAIRRLVAEGRPYEQAEMEESDPDYFFVRWTIPLDAKLPGRRIAETAERAFEEVWDRAERILEDSYSVLILGKDTGDHLERFQEIKTILEDLGHHVYLVREQPDRPGESVIQKVLRFALASKFVIVENTDPSGHLYEFPTSPRWPKAWSRCSRKRARGQRRCSRTGYARHRHWRKFEYTTRTVKQAIEAAARWANEFVREFSEKQRDMLPWLRKPH